MCHRLRQTDTYVTVSELSLYNRGVAVKCVKMVGVFVDVRTWAHEDI